MDSKIEQYKILWELFNQEMHRFWLRYNVLIGIQIAVIVTVIKTLGDELKEISILVTFLLIMLSIVTDQIVLRTIKIYKFNLRNIKEFEENNSEFDLLTTNNNFESLESPYAYHLARWITVTLVIIWIGYGIYQISDYLELIAIKTTTNNGYK